MRAATEGNLPPVMPQGNLVEVLGREVKQGSPGALMVDSSPSRQKRPPCKTDKETSDEAADAAALTYLLTRLATPWCAKPTDDHTHEHYRTPQLYHYAIDRPTTTNYTKSPPLPETASYTESGGVSTRHSMRVP